MATIKNVIETKFTSSGASKVAKDTETVSRSQTRLGQSSAGNARQFAAQANGLGGLVAAYAGAAATVFALEAAYTALAKAAQSDTILQGTNTLAAELSQSGPRILQSIKDITDGQVTLTEAAQNANIALAAGFNAEQIEGFTEVALKASRALGRDFTDSLQRITRGVAKLEPELLDELGIFTRIEPAVQRYARQLGVSAKSLNEFQRRQAFANAAIEEGQRKFSSIDTSSASTQKTLEQLRVKILELGTEFTKIIVGFLTPFVEFITDDAGNALLVFAGIAALVFNKTLQIISSFSASGISKLSEFSAVLADKGKFDLQQLETLRNKLNQPINAGGLKGIRTKELADQDPAQAKRFKAALELQREAVTLSASQLNKVTNEYKIQKDTLDKLGRTSSESYKNLTLAIERNEQAIKKAGGSITRYIGLSNALNSATVVLSRAMAIFGGIISGVFTAVAVIQLVGTIFDVDLLGAVINAFKDMSQAAKDIEAGFTGVALAAAGGGAALTASLKRLGATDEQLEQIPETLRTLRTEIEQTARASAKIKIVGGAKVIESVTDSDRLTALNALIEERQSIIDGTGGSLFGNSQEDIEQARIELALFDVLLKSIIQDSEKGSQLVGQIARSSGLSTESVASVLQKDFAKATDTLNIFGVQFNKVKGQFTFENLTDEQVKLVESGVLARASIVELNSAIEAGSVSAQKVGTSIAGLDSNLIVLKARLTAVNAQIRDGTSVTDSLRDSQQTLVTEINNIESSLRVYKNLEEQLLKVEKVFQGITKVFSREIGLVDTAQFDGLVSINGQIAASQEEQRLNQIALLGTTIALTSESNRTLASQIAIKEAIKGMTVDQVAEFMGTLAVKAETYNKSVDAAVGLVLNLVAAAKQLTAEYNKQTAELQTQLMELQNEQVVVTIQAELDTLNLQTQIADQLRNADIGILQAEIGLIEAKKSAGDIPGADAIAAVSAKQEEILNLQVQAEDARYQTALQTIELEQQMLDARVAADIANLQAQSDLAEAEARNRFEAIKSQAQVLEDNLRGLSGVNNQFITNFAATVTSASANLNTAIRNAIMLIADSGVTTPNISAADIPELGASLSAGEAAMEGYIEALRAVTTEQTTAVVEAYANSSTQLEAKKAAEDALFAKAMERYGIEFDTLDAQTRAKLKQEAESGSKEKEKLTYIQEKLQELFNSIKGNIENAIMGINDLIFYGEGNIGDIMSNLFKSIQQDFFKTTVADPLSGFLTDTIFSLGGITGMRTGIENAKVENGALLVSVVSGPADIFGVVSDAVPGTKDSIKGGNVGVESLTEGTKGIFSGFFDQITSLFTNIFGQNGFVSNLFKGLMGEGGILSGLFKGIGGFFSSLIGFSQGGLVHLAQGGAAVSASLNRDRVPAMLEPGEFVIRKQSAEKIGMPALQSMNATGGAGGNGNVFVNVTNEGSPKQADASAPRFDGEKYVVDIVMRDIANNGPIRRTLRGRGGL